MVTVFGSINLDISVRSPQLPRPGETVMGDEALLSPGGKGANQAHAARRYGAPTRLFGQVGADSFAAPALARLREAGVDLSGVQAAAGQPTGLALITVGQGGENAIVVVPGANRAAHAAQVPDAALRASRVLLLQLEVPWAASQALARRARRLGCKVVLNASPLPSQALQGLDAVDLLIVNQVELDQLCKQHGVRSGDALQSAQRLAAALRLAVLVTLGADGSLLVGADGQQHLAGAVPVQAVDSTGAGDTYAGVLCAALAEGEAPARAMACASAAAALACLKPGAQLAQPARAEIEALMAKTTTSPRNLP